jgi:hypothetical protein
MKRLLMKVAVVCDMTTCGRVAGTSVFTWRWRLQVPPKCSYPYTKLQDVTPKDRNVDGPTLHRKNLKYHKYFYDEFYLLGYNSVDSVDSKLMFGGDMSPPSSGLKREVCTTAVRTSDPTKLFMIRNSEHVKYWHLKLFRKWKPPVRGHIWPGIALYLHSDSSCQHVSWE